MLASLKCFRTYVPLSTATPKKRIDHIIKIIKPDMILSDNLKFSYLNNFHKLKKEIFNDRQNFITKDNNNKIAYIIFTSGSSGSPKGVCVSRKALMHFLEWYTKAIRIKNNFKCSQIPQIGFDLSVADILGNLNSGGNIFPLKDNFYKLFPEKYLYKNKISHLVCVPSFIDMFSDVSSFKKPWVFKKNIFLWRDAS